jgi:hypothetical protein
LPLQLVDRVSEAKSVVLLRFSPERGFYDTNTPLIFQIGSFSENLLFEIVREPVLAHNAKIAALIGSCNQPGQNLAQK